MKTTEPKFIEDPNNLKLLATCYTLSHRFPEYPGIRDMYVFSDDYPTYRGEDTESLLVTGFIESLEEFLNEATENEIEDFFNCLHIEDKLQPAKIHIRKLLPEAFESYKPSRLKGVPRQFTRPLIPLVLANRHDGAIISLSKPIIKKTGQTQMEITSVALFPRDMKTLVALTEIMKTSKVEKYGAAFVSFRTRIVDIAREMGYKNPSAENVRKAIWSSLERMRACTITWTDKRGLRTIGGILSKAKELEEDSALEIDIYLDCDFLNIYDGGFANLNKDALYKMTDREICLYMFFDGQVNYKKYGKYVINILDLYDRITIEVPGTNCPEKKKRHVMQKLIDKGIESGIIGNYTIKNDVLKIHKRGTLFENEKNSEPNNEEPKPNNEEPKPNNEEPKPNNEELFPHAVQ